MAQVVKLGFQQDLGRAASSAEVSYWANRLENGLSETMFYANLVSSQEFYGKASS